MPARDALAADLKLPRDGCQVQPASGEQASRLEAATLQASEVALCSWHVLIVTENGPYVTILCEKYPRRASLLTLEDRMDRWIGTRRKITPGRSGVNQSVRSWENYAALGFSPREGGALWAGPRNGRPKGRLRPGPEGAPPPYA